MRLSHVRFTVRQMMVAVAVFAMLMATGRAGWHSFFCWRMAESHALLGALGVSRCGMERPTAEEERAHKRDNKILAEYHARQERKYRRAAWRPWEPVLPDPYPFPRM
jgi:hypothetical protein